MNSLKPTIMIVNTNMIIAQPKHKHMYIHKHTHKVRRLQTYITHSCTLCIQYST